MVEFRRLDPLTNASPWRRHVKRGVKTFTLTEEQYAHIENTTPPGGLVRKAGDTAQIWFRVDDIRAAAARVQELGGEASEPSESASGWHCDCRDDQGTRFSLWQPAPGYA